LKELMESVTELMVPIVDSVSNLSLKEEYLV